ncbi:MAG: hypothetical protein BECKG1743E_GA0114224_106428, partial [Candidatus Kentron sp. G]
YGIESRRKNCVYILVLPPMTIQCQYHWLLSLRGGRVTPTRIDVSEVEKGDIVEIQLDVDVNRTLIIWVSNSKSKSIKGIQINNHHLAAISSRPLFYDKKHLYGMNGEGYNVGPIQKAEYS